MLLSDFIPKNHTFTPKTVEIPRAGKECKIIMDKYIGKVLDGRYEILEEVGNGGMAVVYKAKDFDTGAIVAVKILREEYLDNEEFCRRFRN